MKNFHGTAQALFFSICIHALSLKAQIPVAGYINVVLRPGLNLVGLQLETFEPTVSALYPKMPEGTVISKIVDGAFIENTFRGGRWDRPDETIAVGEGVFVQNPALSGVTVTFGGQLEQGNLTNPIPAGLSIRGCVVPKSGKLTTELGLQLFPFDNVYLLTNGALRVFTYLPDGGWNPFEPKLNQADSFLIDAAQPTNWITHFDLSDPFGMTMPNLPTELTTCCSAATPLVTPAAEGTVNFANGAALVNAPVVLASGGAGVAGQDWQVELLMQSNSEFISIGGPRHFESGALAGYFFGGSVSVPGKTTGNPAIIKIRVVNLASHFMRESEPVTVTLGGNITPPANLVGLAPLIVPVPVKLSITPIGQQIALSWPKEATNMQLQFATDFSSAWQNLGLPENTNATVISTIVDISAIPRFFRLISF